MVIGEERAMKTGDLPGAIADYESGCFGEEETDEEKADAGRDGECPEDPAPAGVLS